jgi:hypothetical protein
MRNLTTFDNSQRIHRFAFLEEKSTKLATLFLAFALRNPQMRYLAYDDLFIFYWRICRTGIDSNFTVRDFNCMVRDFNFTVRKSHTGT